MSDNRNDKMRKLVILLYTKTKQKAIGWVQVGDSINRRISASIGGNVVDVEIYRYKRGGEGTVDVRVIVRNPDDLITDTITDSELSRWAEPPEDYSSWYLYMREIIDNAERQILRSDDVLDDIISSLE